MRIAIAGGNGFIGRELTDQLLEAGHEVVWLSHRPGHRQPPEGVRETAFDPVDVSGDWTAEIAAADGVVNLSGYPIAKYWTKRVKPLLRSSRIVSTEAIARQIVLARAAGKGPRVLVNASAVGIYGEGHDRILSEDSPLADDFLAMLVFDWEDAARHVTEVKNGCRVVMVRTGIVLGSEGVLPRMLMPARLFLGGPIGNGRQWVSWIHRADIAGIYRFALEHDNVSGPVNAGAPAPIRMTDFAAAVAHSIRRPSWLPVPLVALEVILGEAAHYTVMSQRMSAAKILEAGYKFRFPELRGAIAALVDKHPLPAAPPLAPPQPVPAQEPSTQPSETTPEPTDAEQADVGAEVQAKAVAETDTAAESDVSSEEQTAAEEEAPAEPVAAAEGESEAVGGEADEQRAEKPSGTQEGKPRRKRKTRKTAKPGGETETKGTGQSAAETRGEGDNESEARTETQPDVIAEADSEAEASAEDEAEDEGPEPDERAKEHEVAERAGELEPAAAVSDS